MFEYQVSVWGGFVNLSQLHEVVSIDLWYQHVRLSCSILYRTISGMMYTYRLSVIACKFSVKLCYTITELVACLCVYFYSKLNPTLSLPAICSYTWVSIYTNLHCNMVANTCCWRVPMQPINAVCGQMFLTSRIYLAAFACSLHNIKYCTHGFVVW